MAPVDRPDDESVRLLADEILARPGYARFRAMQNDWILEIADWLADASAWMARLEVEAPALYWLIFAALAGVALLLVLHVIVALRAALRAAVADPPPAPSGSGVSLASEAAALARDGRFLRAARRLQLACIELLLRKGRVELARHETNRDLRRRLLDAQLPDQDRGEFLALLDQLERRWFRDGVAEPALYEAWLSLHERLARLPQGRV